MGFEGFRVQDFGGRDSGPAVEQRWLTENSKRLDNQVQLLQTFQMVSSSLGHGESRTVLGSTRGIQSGDSTLKVRNLRFRIRELLVRISDFEFRVSGFGFWISDFGSRV